MDDKLYRKLMDLFSKSSKEVASHKPQLHETWDYQSFLQEISVEQISEINAFFAAVYDDFTLWHQDLKQNHAIQFINNPKISGFAVNKGANKLERNFCLRLMALTALRLKQQNYHIQISDVRTHQRGESIETIYRIYLKPTRARNGEQKVDQKFGNISLETTIVNDHLSSFVVKVTKYSDHQFHEASNFIDLLKSLNSWHH